MTEHETQNLDDSHKLDLILERLTALEQKAEDRSRETRPLWDKIEARFNALDVQLEDIKKELILVNRKIDKLSGQVLQVAVEHEMLEDRVTKLEKPSGIQ